MRPKEKAKTKGTRYPRGYLVPFALAFFISSSGYSADFPLREIKIRAAVSSQFKNNPDWQTEIRNRVIFANQIFEPTFQVHFSVKDYLPWKPIDETREMGLLIEEIDALAPLGGNEILMGFHQMTKPLESDVVEDIDKVGSARFFHGIAVIRDPAQNLEPHRRSAVLAHELGHIFGAVHVSGDNAIMRPQVPGTPDLIFDNDNRDIIQATRAVDFRKGTDSLSPETIDQLIAIYERLIRASPMSDFYYQLGHFYRSRGLEARAVSIWEEAIRYQYDNPTIHRELGYFYYHQGRYDLAIREIGSAIAHFILPSQQKERALAHNFLGVAYYTKGNIEQAIFTWLKGLTSDPDNRDLQSNLAAAYLETGSLDRGIGELEKLVAKYPEDATLLSNLGVATIKKKEPEKAVDLFRTALEKRAAAPPSSDSGKSALMKEISEGLIRQNLGAALLEMGRIEEAVAELEASEKLEPDNLDVHRNLAQAYMKLRAFDKAVKEIDWALRYKQDDPYLYAFLAQAKAETGSPDEALSDARKALQWADDDLKASLRKNIAGILANQGKLKEAIYEMKVSLGANWNDAEAHSRIGKIYLQANNKEEAKRSLQIAVRMNPQDEEAKKMLATL